MFTQILALLHLFIFKLKAMWDRWKDRWERHV